MDETTNDETAIDETTNDKTALDVTTNDTVDVIIDVQECEELGILIHDSVDKLTNLFIFPPEEFAKRGVNISTVLKDIEGEQQLSKSIEDVYMSYAETLEHGKNIIQEVETMASNVLEIIEKGDGDKWKIAMESFKRESDIRLPELEKVIHEVTNLKLRAANAYQKLFNVVSEKKKENQMFVAKNKKHFMDIIGGAVTLGCCLLEMYYGCTRTVQIGIRTGIIPQGSTNLSVTSLAVRNTINGLFDSAKSTNDVIQSLKIVEASQDAMRDMDWLIKKTKEEEKSLKKIQRCLKKADFHYRGFKDYNKEHFLNSFKENLERSRELCKKFLEE